MKTFLFILLSTFYIISNAQNIPLYVGTYTGDGSEGIYYYNFNTKTGALSAKKLAIETENPSFIAFSSNKKFIYSVGEVDNYQGSSSGFISAYEVLSNGNLKFLNKVSSNGAHPCHIALNSSNTKLAVSNYTGGSISIYSVNKKGTIESVSQIIDHNTTSKKSHAHSAKFFKDNLFIADLGLDLFAQYVLEKGQRTYRLKNSFKMKENAGPRHFEISKKGKFLYVINELNSTVTVLEKQNDTYTNIQDVSTLDENFKAFNACADIHLSKNEQFLYGSNRGENSIVVFKRDLKSGKLQKTQTISTHGDWPRNFTIVPNGKFLLVANQRSKNISVYSINKTTGALNFKYSIDAPAPACLLF
ncbi:lactonase family protein [Lutibacter sp.]|uniref:lactonase family protein n=1 Tax=Lutibacter sp. TaxID=1925666 RepID=UPI0027376826|nr:lactonase family protein [Lutibacter sp.]MDP3313863.1 lactonase family protein [Lutibacter sp.]